MTIFRGHFECGGSVAGIRPGRMPCFRAAMLELYYYGSAPYRRAATNKAARRGRVPVVGLFYHRVDDDLATPWTVGESMFTRQIEWLRRHFEMISLAEAQRRVVQGNARPCVCLSFDDGYADNGRHAVPLLVRHRIPCTYFVTLHNVITGRPFEHDVARGHRFAPNTIEELRAMAHAGIEIGLHCRNHVNVAALDEAAQLEDEIVIAGKELARAVGRPIRYFAFPFGQKRHLSAEGFRVARRAGFAGVCSAYGGYNVPGDDPFHLQRFHVDHGMARLKNNATVDPRKRALPRCDFPAEATEPNRPAAVPSNSEAATTAPAETGPTDRQAPANCEERTP
jgi:peptidoglycan/xylan/chitin deacetylase (PgdA/CDA1 family)